MRAVLALGLVAACSSAPKPTQSAAVRPHALTAAERILPLFPEGAQVIIELDLARLRANPVVGEVIRRALVEGAVGTLPSSVPLSPLARANTIVLAAYGVGTAQAATVTVMQTTEAVELGTPIGDDLVALGPEEWVAQIEARAALAHLDQTGRPPLLVSPELLALRDHAMPPGAPGAALRITARLPFDARVSLARQTGLETAPAQLSVWGDVVDDLVLIVDADAADPGDKAAKHPTRKLEAVLRAALSALEDAPEVRALGLPESLDQAHVTTRGSWLRTIIAVGPAHLRRVVERATALLEGHP